MARRPKQDRPPETRHSLPLTGYEAIARCVPRLRETAKAAALAARAEQTDPHATVHPEAIADLADVEAFLENFARRELRQGATREAAIGLANLVGTHLFCAINHELHRRKVFWVDEALAYMLAHTDLDIQGGCLHLPFPAFCVMFTDPETLAAAGEVLAAAEDCEIAGEPLEVLSVYVTRIDEPGHLDQMDLSVTFVFGSTLTDWPYLVARDLCVRPEATLADILASHFDDASPDLFFNHPALAELVRLVINAILYATSAQFEGVALAPPKARTRNKAGRGSPTLSSLDVVHLPGKISISALRDASRGRPEGQGGIVAKRFMVRGHWRRPNPQWSDQRLRWIEPYWKGPEMATIIEQEYRMRL